MNSFHIYNRRTLFIIFLPLLLFSLFLSAQGFSENKGQVYNQNFEPNPKVKYILNTEGLTISLKKDGFSYDFYEKKKIEIKKTDSLLPLSFYEMHNKTESYKYLYHRIDFTFLNTNDNLELLAENEYNFYNNYYNNTTEVEGFTKVRSYKKIIYKNAYQNIDIEFFIPHDRTKPVEYNFILHKGANIEDIRIKIEGTNCKLLDGSIQYNTRHGKVLETIPSSWLIEGEEKEEVKINFKKVGNNIFGLSSSININSRNELLIIDPTPIREWGTYYGGSDIDNSRGVLTDSEENIYIYGSTTSANNIATTGVHQVNLNPEIPFGIGFIAKLDSDGNRIWSTYYDVVPSDIAIDSNFNIIFTGGMSNWANYNVSTPDAFQTSLGMFNDAFLVKLNNDGTRAWGTWYGSESNERGYSVCVDVNDNIYFAGHLGSSSDGYLATPGSHLETNPSTANYSSGFIAKFSPTGNRIWGTYYGGDKADGIVFCEIHNSKLYVSGIAWSDNGIATPGAYQETLNGTDSDGFIAEFSLDGTRNWGTYIGGEGVDSFLIGTIKNNHIYLAGRTHSLEQIATPGTFYDSFIQDDSSTIMRSQAIIKFNLQSQQKIWGTYFFTWLRGVSVNEDNEVFFSGETFSESGIATPGAFMTERGEYYKSFLIKLNADGQREWGTYYGGDRAEQFGYNTVSDEGYIYLFGNTNGSTSGIATPGAHQETLGSNPDTYLVKFNDCEIASSIWGTENVCVGETISLNAEGGVSYQWSGPNGFNSTEQNPEIINSNTAHSGTYTVHIINDFCSEYKSIEVFVGDNEEPVPDITNLPIIEDFCNVEVTAIPTALDNCLGEIVATTEDPLLYQEPGSYEIIWVFDDGNGNILEQTQHIIVNEMTDLVAESVDFRKCDLDSDGIEFFDLTLMESEINTSLSDNLSFYYYLTEEDRENNNPIPSTEYINFQNTINNQPIYVKIITLDECIVYSQINLILDPLPSANNYLYEVCEINTDEISEFDLNDIKELINPEPSVEINFYLDAELSTQIISETSYENEYNNQIIYTQVLDQNGCINYSQVTLYVKNVIITPLEPISICDDNNDGFSNIHFNFLDAILVDEIGFIPMSIHYYDSIMNLNTNNPLFDGFTNTSNPQTIYAKVNISNQCPQVFQFDIIIKDSPIITINNEYKKCPEQSITIDAGDSYNSYLWSTGETSQTIEISNPGEYFLTVSIDGCFETKEFLVLNYIAPEIIYYIANNELVINVVGENAPYEFSFDQENWQASNVFSNLQTGEHVLYVRDNKGCINSKLIKYIGEIPNVLTLNGDGKNDLWDISFLGNIKSVSVFNRYGKIIFSMSGNNGSYIWDGTYLGRKVNTGNYFYIVELDKSEKIIGYITVKNY